tara:strand:- start:7773 stop:8099 length:327 start_codon:yes stop_codon:yes gene_type:complete
MSCFFPPIFSKNFMKKLKIYLFIFFASALVLGCRAVKAVGNFFTGTTEKAIETTEKVVGSTIKGVPVEVEHNFSLEPVIIWAIIAIMIALAARYLINKYVYGKKITKK